MDDAFLTEALLNDLLHAARAAQARAYAPYSHFHVGAAVLDDLGRIHAGCNVENAAYPQGVCAEAGALSAMVLAGSTQVRAVAVVGDGEGLVTPCGGCRQKLREFAGPDALVFVGDRHEIRARFTLDQLLPESFGPAHLGMPGTAQAGRQSKQHSIRPEPAEGPSAGRQTLEKRNPAENG